MSVQYLVRFDDICPTMNWEIWEQVESILQQNGIKPILAVIPDNQDKKLQVDPPKADFWERVRSWQRQGWTIALHGYQHVFESSNSGLIGINSYSEFAGLSYDIQRHKVERALSIFSREGICADAWVAPAHTFDVITVQILGAFGVKVISDGFYCRPVSRMGAFWIPQQMWRFRPMPSGVWTICFHHNRFKASDVEQLKADIEKYKQAFVTVDELLHNPVKNHCMKDTLFSALWLLCLKLKRKFALL